MTKLNRAINYFSSATLIMQKQGRKGEGSIFSAEKIQYLVLQLSSFLKTRKKGIMESLLTKTPFL